MLKTLSVLLVALFLVSSAQIDAAATDSRNTHSASGPPPRSNHPAADGSTRAHREPSWVEWSLGPQASPVFARLLATSPSFPEVTVGNYVADQPIDSADCVTHVLRPASGGAGIRNPDNRVVCTFRQGQQTGSVTLSLASEAIEPWGSYGSPRAFQFRGALVGRLIALFQQASRRERANPILESTYLEGPGGSSDSSYGLRRNPDVRLPDGTMEYGQLAVSCPVIVYAGSASSFCSFLVFD